MKQESRYWSRFWRSRLSRRRLLGGAALGGGALAAAAIAGCGSEGGTNGRTSTRASTIDSSRTSDVPIADARRPFEAPPPNSLGGTLRFTGFDALVLDSFDPHLTQFGPLYGGHSAVFSKLYKYVSHEEQLLEPDLAEEMPELGGDDPEKPTEFVIKLRRGVRFHDPASLPEDVRQQVSIRDAAARIPGLPGRELTADDVVYSFRRQKDESSPRYPLFYRSSQYRMMERIERIDDYTVKITTAEPISPMLHFLGDTNAFILPREVVDEEMDTLDFANSEPQGRLIGTGPFVWGELKSLQEFTAFRNPSWFGWDQPELGRPFLDGYVSSFIVDNATNESLFRSKDIDVGGASGADPTWVFDIKDEMPELEFLRGPVSGWVNSRFKVVDKVSGAPCIPWGDARVRKAMHLAVDRQQVIDFIWAGEGIMVGSVGPVIEKWALPADELATIPGYRTGADERAEDIALGKQLYEEAGSPEIEFTFADQPAYIPDFAPSFLETLRQNLGTSNVKEHLIRAYPQIAEGFLKGCDQIQAYWGYDNGWIDLDDWLYPYFHSTGPKNSFGVNDPQMDKLLDAQRREFDEGRRRELGYQIQRYLLGVDPAGSGEPLELKPDSSALARLDYATLINSAVSWPYYRNRYSFPWFGNNHWTANQWLDRNDPSYQGRA